MLSVPQDVPRELEKTGVEWSMARLLRLVGGMVFQQGSIYSQGLYFLGNVQSTCSLHC